MQWPMPRPALLQAAAAAAPAAALLNAGQYPEVLLLVPATCATASALLVPAAAYVRLTGRC